MEKIPDELIENVRGVNKIGAVFIKVMESAKMLHNIFQ